MMDQRQLPPGRDEKYRTAEDLLEWMSRGFEQFGNIYRASIYGSSTYVTRNPDHAQHVLVDNSQNYIKGQFINRVAFLLGNGLMVSKGGFWKAQRRMIQPAFHRKAIGKLTRLIAETNIDLREKWKKAAQNGENVNVTHDVSRTILKVVLVATFGSDYEQIAGPFGMVSDESARNPQFAHEFRSLGKLILQITDRRRKAVSTSTDFLGMLMEARDQHGRAMQDSQLINEILTLIVAGHETTASALNWTWYLISQHPDVEKRLSEELNKQVISEFPELEDLSKFIYTCQVIEESLRLYPAGWLMTRKALNDDHLHGYFVPAGTEIYVAPYFIQRNPDLWEDPDHFNPDRFSVDHSQQRHRLAMLPFSAGPRNCIGEFFARIEMQIHLMMIAKHLRLSYAPARSLELEAGVNLRNRYDFIMTPKLKTSAESYRDE